MLNLGALAHFCPVTNVSILVNGISINNKIPYSLTLPFENCGNLQYSEAVPSIAHKDSYCILSIDLLSSDASLISYISR